MMNDARRYLATVAAGLAGGAAGGAIVACILGWVGDYLGFFGALLGAGATILAGYIALNAVREQIRAVKIAGNLEAVEAIEITLVFVGAVERSCSKLSKITEPLVTAASPSIPRDEAREIWLKMKDEVAVEMALVEHDDIQAILRRLPVTTWRPLRALLLFPAEVERLRRLVAKTLQGGAAPVSTPIQKAGLLSEGIEQSLTAAMELRVELEMAREALA